MRCVPSGKNGMTSKDDPRDHSIPQFDRALKMALGLT